ncbi:MAG: alpha/beta hydrolase fold domain-containing protein [Verrucomicrobiae bacterium]|nr:alpha/beta hydrolase fold domain-containing protein [Verrucomicrobiae bacterium]
MKFSRFLFLLALFGPITFSITEADAQRQSPFDLWDKNSDGKLVREELPAPLRRNFDRVDRDGDGFISRGEDAAFRSQNRPAPRPSGGGKALEGIKTIADQDYAGIGNPRQTLDLFLPEKPATDDPLPVVVFIHGGGWQNGDKGGGGRKLMPLLATGKYAGASIGYRLSDEAQWPSQIHDCKAAIRWIRAHAEEYHLDPKRIAVWGTSAGGHLVAMLGTSHGVEDLEGDIGPNTGQDSSVQAVADFFGPTEMLTMGKGDGFASHDSPESPESKLLGGPVQEVPDVARSASPIEHVSKDDAPFLIVHGDQDPVVPYAQSVDFEKKLESAGVPAVFITVEGGGHGKGFGPSTTAAVEAFLAKELLGEERELKDGSVKAGE